MNVRVVKFAQNPSNLVNVAILKVMLLRDVTIIYL